MRAAMETGYVVRDAGGCIEVILLGADAVETASWYAEDGYEVDEIELARGLVAA